MSTSIRLESEMPESSRQETTAQTAATTTTQTGICASISSTCCSFVPSPIQCVGSMVYSGGSFVVTAMLSPIESTKHAIACAQRKYDLYGQYIPMCVGGVVTASAGSTLATLFTSTATVTAAIIGPVTLALAGGALLTAGLTTSYAKGEQFLASWSWTAFIPMAGVAWATATPFAAVVAMTALAAGAVFLSFMAADAFKGGVDGNISAEQRNAQEFVVKAAGELDDAIGSNAPEAEIQALTHVWRAARDVRADIIRAAPEAETEAARQVYEAADNRCKAIQEHHLEARVQALTQVWEAAKDLRADTIRHAPVHEIEIAEEIYQAAKRIVTAGDRRLEEHNMQTIKQAWVAAKHLRAETLRGATEAEIATARQAYVVAKAAADEVAGEFRRSSYSHTAYRPTEINSQRFHTLRREDE